MNVLKSSVDTAFTIVSKYIHKDVIAVDATCGNGHDTLALACAGVSCIYAFDIQETAINNTKKLINDYYHEHPGYKNFCKNISYINDNHSNICKYISTADVILFNLGYLPGGDKQIVTSSENTLKAISSAVDILRKDGICSILMYSGHPGGAEEKETILTFAKSLDSSIYHAAYIQLINQHKNPPEALLITKKKG